MKQLTLSLLLLFSYNSFSNSEKKILVDGRYFNINLNEKDRWIEWTDEVPLNLGTFNANAMDNALTLKIKVVDPVKVYKYLSVQSSGSCGYREKEAISGVVGESKEVVFSLKYRPVSKGNNICIVKVRDYGNFKVLINVVDREEM
jgi:hypothetical protein